MHSLGRVDVNSRSREVQIFLDTASNWISTGFCDISMESNTAQTQRMNFTISIILWAVDSFHISGESFTTDRFV